VLLDGEVVVGVPRALGGALAGLASVVAFMARMLVFIR